MEQFERDVSDSLSREHLPGEAVSLALLARAQRGDSEALQELLERYQPRLRRIVRIRLRASRLRQLHDSMDFVQGTLMAALPRIGELRPRSSASLLNWLSILATHQIRDAYDHQHAAKRDVRREVPIDVHGSRDGAAEPAEDSRCDPGRVAELSELRECLDEAVSELSDDQRQVVLLRDYCGEDWDRIAAELGRESGAARQLHQRAWIKLRRRLRPMFGERGSSSQDREVR
ncbi:MAG: sigma-70 family RNA polymerase sigma factor [Planctomycetota bacterium]